MRRGTDGGAPTSSGTYRFVGRDHELALLLRAVRRPPAAVFIEGEAGIGKSRLVAEATAALSHEQRPVLTGLCHPLREPYPYGPVVDALAKAGPWLPATGMPPAAGALAPLLPDLADRLAAPPVDDPRPERLRTIQAVRSFLSALGPAVLVVEDLHWVDEATRELLLLLARDLPGELSLVLTYRVEGASTSSPVLGSPYRHPPGVSGSVIPLRPLTESDILELATASLGTHATPALAASLFARSEGLPLVAEEDLLTLTEHSHTHGYDGIVATLGGAVVPRGLREAITERLAALSPEGTAVVEAAAVLAVPSPQHLIAQVARLDRVQAATGLVDAIQASVLQEAGEGRYGFRHALAQQVAYQHIAGPRRALLHEQAIDELGRQSPPPLVQIAHHTLALGDRGAWLRRAEEAADQALAVGDSGTAAILINEILEVPNLDVELLSRAALALAGIATLGVDPVEHASHLRRILGHPQLPRAVRGEIRLGLGLLLFNELADSSGSAEIETAVDELGETPERAARAMSALALNERQGRSTAWAWQERAEQTVADSTDAAARAAVQASRLTLLAASGSADVWSMLASLPRESDDRELLRHTARSLVNVADTFTHLGHERRCAPLLEEARDVARRADYPMAECYVAVALLQLDVLAGRWNHLEERFADIVTAYPAMTSPKIDQAVFLGQLAAARGHRAQALEHFTTVAQEGERNVVTSALRAAAGQSTVYLAQGSPAEAWTTAEHALDLLRRSEVWLKATGIVSAAVEAALACGDRGLAERIADEAERGIAGRDGPAASAELAVARGLLCHETDPAMAAGHFAEAEARWRAIGRPYETAQAAERRALALAEVDPGQAVSPLEAAVTTYRSLGATGDLARVQHHSQRLGILRPKTVGRRGYGDRLSPRERQVAELLAAAATNQQIADTLFLSPRTVEQHVANVLRKLGTTRRNVADELSRAGH